MGYLLQSGDSFYPAPSKESLLDKLPEGNYTIEDSPTGMHFHRAERFQTLGPIYGEHEKWSSRIINTFQDRPGNTGVLLAGAMGSGKSLLGRVLSRDAAALGMPTIVINKPLSGNSLGPLLAQLSQPALIFMDEFEKVYSDSHTQETILTLLDGTASTKHLFVLTVNRTDNLDRHLKNRPGRLYYSLEFHGLDEQFIREYCKASLKAQEHVDQIVRLASIFDEFNFDMLKSLVDEMNRYDESPSEAVRFLNISPAEQTTHYKVKVTDPEGNERRAAEYWRGNPLFLKSWSIDVPPLKRDDEDDYASYENITLTGAHLQTYSAADRSYTFSLNGWTVVLTGEARPESSAEHWSSY